MATIESLKAIIEPLRGMIKYQQLQLELLERRLFELENPVETRPLSNAEMKKRVIALEKRKGHKSLWKKGVEAGLLDNVQGIVDECYDMWHQECDHIKTAVKKLGKIGSRHWQIFTLKIIAKLHEDGSFMVEDGDIDTFEDTAGGCDEITWGVGSKLLENSEWMENPNWLV